ncbi:acyltransferase family protein [Rothia sp. P7181]|uniref:acyltransferase family protein n=1 Tax=Rothia sp. P7181 TaxID=3402663 RepID=UPI003AE39AD9
MVAQTHTKYPLNRRWLKTQGFRPEIQGLRALALFLVVTYHIWFGKVSGGVDVFLFISAFLLSLSTLRKINEGKPLALIKYWLHVFQRLLPAAATVIAGTVIASWYFLSPSRIMGIIHDGIAALLYFLNWRLAYNSVDYYAQDAATKTPLQHFWSLSMQGQIFILWPILFLCVALLVRRFRLNLIGTALLVFGTVWGISLAFSIYETATNQGFAYFDTRTRAWEFATGTLLAIVTFYWKPPRWLRIPMGWVGVAGLILCGLILPVQEAFPGYLALWPVTCGALVILAGQTNSPWGVDRILSSTPLLKLGEISYALYLVHWPVYIIYSTRARVDHPDFLVGSLLIISSIVIATIIHYGIEEPLRRTPTVKKHAVPKPHRGMKKLLSGATARPIAIILSCLMLVGVPLVGAKAWVHHRNNQLEALAEAAGSPDFPGAYAYNEVSTHYKYPPIPTTDPEKQYDGIDPNGCGGLIGGDGGVINSLCGLEQNSSKADSPLMMVIGSSHAGQSIAFYRPWAQEHQTNLMDLHLGACRYPLEAEPNPNEECEEYNANIRQLVLDVHPEAVALLVTQTDAHHSEILVPGIEEEIEAYTRAGIPVLALRDNPRWADNIYDCAQTHPEDPTFCGEKREQKLADINPAQDLIDRNPLVYGLDFSEQYCPDGFCSPIFGNVYVYMDDNHISRAYGSTLDQELNRQLQEQGFSLGRT